MSWFFQATSHYLNLCWPMSMSPDAFTSPQWVNMARLANQFDEYRNPRDVMMPTLSPLVLSPFVTTKSPVTTQWQESWHQDNCCTTLCIPLRERAEFKTFHYSDVTWVWSCFSKMNISNATSLYHIQKYVFILFMVCGHVKNWYGLCIHLFVGPPLLTWINFNPTMDK